MNMKNHQQKSLEKLILPLIFYLKLSGRAYSKYLNNKIYLHALCIRSSNRKIYDLIVRYPQYIPEQLHPDAVELLNHFDIWQEQFIDEEMKKRPSLNDSFIFFHLDDQSAYPKKSEENILIYCKQLKDLWEGGNNYASESTANLDNFK
jgi:hypothetical protein